MTRKVLALAAAILAATLSLAYAGSGTLTIGTVSGSAPGPYTLTMTSSVSGVTVGDDFGAFLSDGTSAIYRVTTVTGGSLQLVVADVRTSAYGTYFGPPATGSAWYATPAGGGHDHEKLARPPKAARAWDAALNLNATALGSRILASAGAASVSSSTSAYANAREVAIPTNLWAADGDAVRVTANLRLAAGSGVNMRLQIETTASTAITAVGTYQFMIVREDSNTLAIYSDLGAAGTRNTVTGWISDLTVTLQLQLRGGSSATGAANDFWVVEKVR